MASSNIVTVRQFVLKTCQKKGAFISRFCSAKTYQLMSDRGSLAKRSSHLLCFPLSLCNDIDDVSCARCRDQDFALGEQAREERNVHHILLLCRRHLVLWNSPFGRDGGIESRASFLADFFPGHDVEIYSKDAVNNY
jgi:hypothetical protein